MYLAGVSVRRVKSVKDITEALWGSKVSPATISDLYKKPMSTLRIGGIALCRAATIRMYMWMVSTCGATRDESMKMSSFGGISQ